MANITKCGDSYCPARANCWRFAAPPSSNQAYGEFPRKGRDRCDSYWHVTDRQKRDLMRAMT